MMHPDNKLRILAVDDSRTNLLILQTFLQKLGHEVTTADNGKEAIAHFDREQPDIILMDIMMPVMDGLEATRQIKTRPVDRWIPIVFLSALDRDEHLVEGLEAGGDDYLTKPINFVVLEAKIRSMQRSLMLQQNAIESYKRLQAISDNVLESIVTIDTSGIIQASNQATEYIFGWRPDELLGQNVKVLMPEHYARDHDDNIRHYVMGGPPRFIGSEREVEAQRKDGTVFPANLGITEVRLDNNRMFIGVIRDISEQKRAEQKLLENAAQLKAYYEQTENEQHLAKQLMNKQLHRRGLDDKCLRYMVLPAQNFSGDVVAATRSAEGRFYALLADATGHGLAAAISALPILSVFYRMAGFDRPVRELVQEFNLQLKESMPVGRFLAATVVCLDHEKRQGEIWVGGTPEAYLVNRHGDIDRRFASIQLPLGIVDNRDIDPNPVTFSWDRDSQLLLCSDGLLEAENVDHAPFGTEGLTQAIAGTSPKERFEAIHTALDKHLHQSMAADDVSLMLIDCP